MSPFIKPFVDVLLIILDILYWTVMIWVVLSWVLFFVRQTSARWRYPRLYRFLDQLNDLFTRMTHPFLKPFRRLLRRFDTAGIDWSPLLLLLAIYVLQRLIVAAYGAILFR